MSTPEAFGTGSADGDLSVQTVTLYLIALKRLANRPQDLVDIEKLTEIEKPKQHRDDD